MPRKRHTPEQNISKLREAGVGLAGGQTVPEVCRTLGVAEQTYYCWRKEYVDLKVEQARRFKEIATGGDLNRTRGQPFPANPLSLLAPRAGLEPATWWLTATRSTN